MRPSTGCGSGARAARRRHETMATEPTTAKRTRLQTLPRAAVPENRCVKGERRAVEDSGCTALKGASACPHHERAEEERQIENGNAKERTRPARAGVVAQPPASPT